jgi:DNA polymerase V
MLSALPSHPAPPGPKTPFPLAHLERLVEVEYPAILPARLPIPLFARVSAGFPSPAGDYLEKGLDLNELMVPRPSATFYIRVHGPSMNGAGIFHGDILAVDRSVDAVSGRIVVASINGEFLVKELDKPARGAVRLLPHNPDFEPIVVKEGDEVHVFGVVIGVIRKY